LKHETANLKLETWNLELETIFLLKERAGVRLRGLG
jgi:hypothetical protein